MTGFFILVGVVLLLMASYFLLQRSKSSRFLAAAEYWVYLPGVQMPSQDAMLTRMVGKNPYSQRGRDPIGQSEGIILSDVRLHIALVLRSKNPHVFRPDLFDHVEANAEQLQDLADAKSLVKLRYISEEPLTDKRHIQFLIHAADAMAEIGHSRLIYDAISEKLFTKSELEAELSRSVDATGSDLHVRPLWTEETGECRARTLGLRKIGVEELRTGPMEADEQVLITQVIGQAVEQIWSLSSIPESVEVDAFDDKFRLVFTKSKDGFADIRILRMQAT